MKRWKQFLLVALSLLFVALIWLTYQYWAITKFANDSKPQKADAIIVLGAAVWADGPSPSLKARVNYASKLHKEGYAPYIILSGGQGKYGPTEAEMMKQLLIQDGILVENLILEDQSTNTYENITNSYKLMQEYQLESALIVTDTFHLKRAIHIAKDQGMVSYGAPVFESVLNNRKELKFYYTMREVLALTKLYLRL